MSTQQREEIEITRVIDEYRIARFEQQTAYQIDGLRAGFSEDDLVGRRFNAAIRHAPGKQLPQRRESERRAVVGQHG